MTPEPAEDKGPGHAPRGRGEEAGLRAIIVYKSLKGGAQLASALALAALLAAGRAPAVGRLAASLLRHVAQAWALRAADAIASLLTPHHVALLALALALDGSLTSLEAWALRKGRPWGEWLVVVATGAPLPYEAFELVERPHAARALIFLANLGIVVFLGRRALGRARAAAPL